MKIKVAPFVNIAKPVNPGPLAKAYWQSDVAVETIAVRFVAKSGKAVRKLAGDAVLHGIACKDCHSEIVCTSRGEAIQVIGEFESRSARGIQCRPCFRVERDKRHREQFRKFQQELSNPAIRKAGKRDKRGPVTKDEKQEFYDSWKWHTLRMQTFQKYGRICQCCGAQPGQLSEGGEPIRIVVDHIKPISKHWHLRLDPANVQPLCDSCNMGKGNWDETDFRSPEAPDEWVELPQDDIVLSVLDEMEKGTIQ